jgi:ferrous iron transport protein B
VKKFALAGNPNCGKTTLFNGLTGSTAHVGNWPGVTVDKKEGVYKKFNEPISVVDLPGIYSLSPYTPEEVIARNFILEEKPDCVINIIDATNLERNLYLTTQIMEIDVPVIIALNMMDEVEKAGDSIDYKELEKRIGLPVVPISALKQEGLDALMERAYETCKVERKGVTVLQDTAIKHLISDIRIALLGHSVDNPLFHAIKLIEQDDLEILAHKQTVEMVEEFKKTFHDDLFGNDFEALIADGRYKYITKWFSPVLRRKNKGKFIATKSDKADKVLTHKIWGIPIFLVILFSLFHLTFGEDFLFLGAIFRLPTIEDLGLKDGFWTSLLACVYDGAVFSPGVILFNVVGFLTDLLFGFITYGLESLGASEWVLSFVGDGVFGGLGGILSFVPQIITLLLMLSLLEDTGYMARVAFILDRILRKFGVSGRAFIPMIMGFGCSVPAMINTRTLVDEKERTLTLRTIPFFSCGAKLPILTAVAGAIAHMTGGVDGGVISFVMYVLGMLVAVVSIILMRSTTQRGEVSPFIMELPSYRKPSGKALAIHLWDKTKHYIEKVFTIILASTIIIWFLTNFGWDWKMCDIQDSILASLGKFMQPLFTPLGFGSQLGEYGWVFVVAAITGLVAKEEVISTFATLGAIFVGSGIVSPELSADGASSVYLMIQGIISSGASVTWPALISFIVFNMTTVPCFGAVATAKGETPKGKFKWTLLFWIVTSYVVSAIVYVFSTMFATWSLWSILVSVGIIVLAVVFGVCLHFYNKKRPIKGIK